MFSLRYRAVRAGCQVQSAIVGACLPDEAVAISIGVEIIVQIRCSSPTQLRLVTAQEQPSNLHLHRIVGMMETIITLSTSLSLSLSEEKPMAPRHKPPLSHNYETLRQGKKRLENE